jgi:hypothetical protein
MNKRKDKINKRTLIDRAHSSLDEEFGPTIEPISNIPEDNEINPKKENYKPEGARYNKVRDKGDWECDISEVNPPKRVERVSMFKKLPNGLTPNEIMYGKQDNDRDYITKSLE